MSLASAWAVALQGVDGLLVEIEAHIGPGLPGLHMVGLPDTALSEARDRVRAAVLNSGRAVATATDDTGTVAGHPAQGRKQL